MNRTKPIDAPGDWQALKPHPYAEFCEFGVGIDLDALTADMMNEGYDEREPIVLFDGKILNGRHRHNCAIKAEVVPSFVEYIGKDPLNEAARKFMQQHLDVSQRATLAVKMANAREGRPVTPQNRGVDSPPPKTRAEAAKTLEGRPVTPQNRGVDSPPPKTRAEAAKTFQVSPRAVDYARVVEDHGSEKLQLAIRTGKLKVSDAAKVARKSKAVQDYAVGAVERGEFSTVAAAACLCNPCLKRTSKGGNPLKNCPECQDIRTNGKPKPEKKRKKKLNVKERTAALKRLSDWIKDIQYFLEDAPKLLGCAQPVDLLFALNQFNADVAAWRGDVDAANE